MQLKSVLAAAAAIGALAAPAAAQNSAAEPVTVTVPPPPPAKTDTPPSTTTPPAPTSDTSPPEADTTTAPDRVVVVPQSAPARSEPVAIDPDAAYPNGFADPVDPFANDMSLAYREQSGFDWGLLGLLGLLGLIPLFRDRGSRRVVYVERDDAPRRVVRERIEE
ncbi:MAG: hypothetical protein ACXWUP_07310 [Allosphingosinicella sp.]